MGIGATPDREIALLRSTLSGTYFASAASTLVFSNPKCGSTSLPFLYSVIEGLDPVALCDVAKCPEVKWTQGIHQVKQGLAGLWPNLTHQTQWRAWSDPAVRRVMFVRDPLERCWASWVTKILVREPAFIALCGPIAELTSHDWEERALSSGGLVREFELFAESLVAGSPAGQDQHFAPQSVAARLLPPDTEFLPMTMVGPVGQQIAQAAGIDAEPPRLNESGIAFPREAMSTRTLAALEEFYADDRELFEERVDSRPEAARGAVELTGEQVSLLRLHIRSSQRLATWVEPHWGLKRTTITVAQGWGAWGRNGLAGLLRDRSQRR